MVTASYFSRFTSHVWFTSDHSPFTIHAFMDPSRVESLVLCRVAFQGERGAFGELAIRSHWGATAEPMATRTFDDVVTMVGEGRTAFGVVPVWNSTMGEVKAGRSAVECGGSGIVIVGQVEVPVRHCLLALPGVAIDELRVVASHPAAIEQCTAFFTRHDWLSARVAFDTAGAARELACLGGRMAADEGKTPDSPWYTSALARHPRTLGAIASAEAAAHYGLAVLAEGIQNDATNLTRFVILQQSGVVNR
jgi:prephenate dehydratase